MLLFDNARSDSYNATMRDTVRQAKNIIIWAWKRVIFLFHIIARYLLRVINVIEKIENPKVIMIKWFEILQPIGPSGKPPEVAMTMTVGSKSKLKNTSAQQRPRTNSVSTDLYRTRKMDAMTGVSNKIPKKSKNVSMPPITISCM